MHRLQLKNCPLLFALLGAMLAAPLGCGDKSDSTTAPAGAAAATAAPGAEARVGPPEKQNLKFGFIKLTDCAPLVIAKEKGFFQDEFLNVTLEAQQNWKVLLDRVISGDLDGAHMLAGQPIGATIGIGTQADIETAFSMDLNGNGITVSNDVWKQMQQANPDLQTQSPKHPISATALKPVVDAYKAKGTLMKMGMVFPVSTHNYELRYWLAAGGINPGYYTKTDQTGQSEADVLLSVVPPPQMPQTMQAGTIQGYCVGEPWNQQAVFMGIGVPVVTDYEIWKNNPEKVFGVTRSWAEANPNTHVAVVKAMIMACRWLDESEAHRREAAKILSQAQYVGADEKVIANSMTGTFEYEKGDVRKLPDFNVFYRYDANYPFYSDAIWYLTQMRRWGQIAQDKPDGFYLDTAKKVYKPEIYMRAFNALVKEGKIPADETPKTDGFKPADSNFIDGVTYDARKPNDYLKSLKIGKK